MLMLFLSNVIFYSVYATNAPLFGALLRCAERSMSPRKLLVSSYQMGADSQYIAVIFVQLSHKDAP